MSNKQLAIKLNTIAKRGFTCSGYRLGPSLVALLKTASTRLTK